MYARKYTLYGALFGLAFPLIGTIIEALTRRGSVGLDALLDAHRSPLVWIIGTAPLFLGLLARAAGRKHDLLVAADRARREGWLRAATQLAAAAGQLGEQAQRIRGQAAAQTASASQQAAAAEETTSSATAVARSSAQTEERARAVIALTGRSEELSREGRESVDQAVAGIDRLTGQVAAIAGATGDLAADATRIGEIVEALKEFAEQSKVLALNASIEASRAGQRGAGFGIVATEMRRLSERSHDAAEQVRRILEGVLARARGATAAAEGGNRAAADAIAVARKAADAIQGLAGVASESAAAGREIAEGARQQRSSLDQIVAAMRDLSEGAAGTVDGAGVIETAAGILADASRALGDTVREYRTAAMDGTAAPDAGAGARLPLRMDDGRDG
ncbi:MAG TPA: methyl-accepting chemotaxis protein [Anaeromyxobacteraceae bacterium]|nr:methyl-accepting chemotaxis protein [Anaeromyxobacteraceae bacterium]